MKQSSALAFLILLCLPMFSSSSSPPPIIGIWHVGVVGRYLDVLSDQLSQIERAVFATNFTFVRILSMNYTRNDVEMLFRTHSARERLGRIMFTYGAEEEGREYADTRTSWIARDISELVVRDAIIWFIHNKGVSRDEIEFSSIADWRRMMMYFLFEKEWCVTALSADFYDTCGSNLRFGPQRHYSGTFWMAHSRYIKTLPYASRYWDDADGYGERFGGEFWLLHSSIDASRALCVHDSLLPQYSTPYPRQYYSSAPIGRGCVYPAKNEFMEYLSKS
jgi:hypothetical protein